MSDFQNIDLNGDGFITIDEALRYQKTQGTVVASNGFPGQPSANGYPGQPSYGQQQQGGFPGGGQRGQRGQRGGSGGHAGTASAGAASNTSPASSPLAAAFIAGPRRESGCIVHPCFAPRADCFSPILRMGASPRDSESFR